MTAPKRHGGKRPGAGSGGARVGAGRPVQCWTLGKPAAAQLHSLIRMQRRPGLAILEELIGLAYDDQEQGIDAVAEIAVLGESYKDER